MTSINASNFFVDSLNDILYPLIQELSYNCSRIHNYLVTRGESGFLHGGEEIKHYLALSRSYYAAVHCLNAANNFYLTKKPSLLIIIDEELGLPEDEIVLFEDQFSKHKQQLIMAKQNLISSSRILSTVYSNPSN